MKTTTIQFSGGELHVKVDGCHPGGAVKLLCRIQSPKDLVELLMTNEVIDRLLPTWKRAKPHKKLVIPYFPYARQDRVTEHNVAFSLKVAAKLINDLDFDEVVSCDVHSDVTPALVNNMRVVSQLELITENCRLLEERLRSSYYDAILCPDAGAYKKSNALAMHYNMPLLVAHKVRNVTTGEIEGVYVPDEVANRQVLIADDICDGGRTFIELAKAAKAKKATNMGLYVTHGIFAKGLEPLAEFIDEIYTTDCFLSTTLDEKPGGLTLTTTSLQYWEL